MTTSTSTNNNNQNIQQASLYVGDLHPLVTESMLYATFSNIGHVLSARVCRDVARQSSLGYGYVNFENPKDAERALETLIYENLMGRQIRIMWCVRDPSLRKSGRGNIFIKNLEKNIGQKDLYDTFSQFGKILSCKIAIDDQGNSKGYGFIHFEDENCAKNAIEAVNGKMINERLVYVGPFIPRNQRKTATGKPKFNNCYVKNFGTDLTDDGLKELFAPFGEIKSACVMRDEEKKSKGFGFVCFADPSNAEEAVEKMNGKEVNGQTLYVSRAQRKDERQEALRQQFEKQRNERIAKYAAGVNLYVKNLDDSIDDARLKEAFSKYGKITSAKVMTDANGVSKGFGFVCFTSPDEARDAVKLNGQLLGTKPLYVALAQRREDRRAKLVAEHQQRMQLRPTIPNMPPTHGFTNLFGQAPFNPAQRFFQANAPLGSQPRWNRGGMAGPQVQLGHAGIGAAPSLRPGMPSPYIQQPGAMAAMNQGNFVNPQLRGQAANRAIMPNAMSALSSGAPGGMVAAGQSGPQAYGSQRSVQMLGTTQPMARAAIGSVNAAVRPTPMNQVRPISQTNINVSPLAAGTAAAANVRFNQTARNVMAQQQGPRPVGSPVRSSGIGEQIEDQAQLSNVQQGNEMRQGGDTTAKKYTAEQRQQIGDQIFVEVSKTDPNRAGKITGMLLKMGDGYLDELLSSQDKLRNAVSSCLEVLENKERQANKGEARAEAEKSDRS